MNTKANVDAEQRLLADCAAEGFRVLNAHLRQGATQDDAAPDFARRTESAAGELPGHLRSVNADVFHAALSAWHAAPDGKAASELLACQEVRGDLDRMLAYLRCAAYRETEFERRLAAAVARYTALPDSDIREHFSRRFDIRRVDITALPTERSLFFTKVNHGYWEYMRWAYGDEAAQQERYREIDVTSKVRRLRTSGLTQFWGRQLHGALASEATLEQQGVSLCVSLTAGTEPPAVSIRKELGPVTRGAAAGLLAMFDTALPGHARDRLGDGAATRGLVVERKLEAFVDRYVCDTEACVLLVPPHLRQIDLPAYKGALYRLIVPATRINETWKSVAATLVGYLRRLARQHRSITLLGQGASVVSLIGLLLSEVDPVPGVRLRYFDLGRVLDLAAPEFLAKQAWAMRHLDAYLAEGGKVFGTRGEPDCTLATLV